MGDDETRSTSVPEHALADRIRSVLEKHQLRRLYEGYRAIDFIVEIAGRPLGIEAKSIARTIGRRADDTLREEMSLLDSIKKANLIDNYIIVVDEKPRDLARNIATDARILTVDELEAQLSSRAAAD